MMETQQTLKIRDLKKGEYFKRKPDAKSVYVKGEYCRADRKFSAIDFDDINREILIKPDTLVFVGFEF